MCSKSTYGVERVLWGGNWGSTKNTGHSKNGGATYDGGRWGENKLQNFIEEERRRPVLGHP